MQLRRTPVSAGIIVSVNLISILRFVLLQSVVCLLIADLQDNESLFSFVVYVARFARMPAQE